MSIAISRKSQIRSTLPANDNKRIRLVASSDESSLGHPSHKEQWLELARALGRMDARKDFEAIHG